MARAILKDAGAAAGRYEFVVTAVNTDGIESAYSNAVLKLAR